MHGIVEVDEGGCVWGAEEWGGGVLGAEANKRVKPLNASFVAGVAL